MIINGNLKIVKYYYKYKSLYIQKMQKLYFIIIKQIEII